MLGESRLGWFCLDLDINPRSRRQIEISFAKSDLNAGEPFLQPSVELIIHIYLVRRVVVIAETRIW